MSMMMTSIAKMVVAMMMLLSGGHLPSCKKSLAVGKIILVPANWANALYVSSPSS